MTFTRRRTAQAGALLAAIGVFFPWESGGAGSPSVAGTETNAGRIAFIVALATVALVQIRWRPAWIGAGFVVAVSVRAVVDLSGSDKAGIGWGLWICALAALSAAILLIWDMFAGVRAPRGDEGVDEGRKS